APVLATVVIGSPEVSHSLNQLSCWFSLLVAAIQQPGSSEALEGAELNLTCSRPSTKASDSTVWYRQLPNQGPQFVVSGYKETTRSPDPEGALHFSAERESSPLALRRVRLGDAAVYFCARRDTVGQPAAALFNKPSGVSGR
uniref:Ig-like domain-containing protein n=1 Tax=Gopherus evgoodei TaxID=1825980 RepID=A0A8C4Y6E6_9SAUR